MLEIRTNELRTRKKVLIDNREYTVRKMGNLEELDLQQYISRLNKLAEVEDKQPLNDSQVLEVQDINSKVSLMFVSLFDDGGDQSKSRALVASFSSDELNLMLEQIFKEAKDVQVS